MCSRQNCRAHSHRHTLNTNTSLFCNLIKWIVLFWFIHPNTVNYILWHFHNIVEILALIWLSCCLAEQHANIRWNQLRDYVRRFQIGHLKGSISGCCLYRHCGYSLDFGTEFLTARPMFPSVWVFLDTLHPFDWSVWAVEVWLQPLCWQPQEKDAHLPAGCWQYMSQHVLRIEARWLQSFWLWDHQPKNILNPAS